MPIATTMTAAPQAALEQGQQPAAVPPVPPGAASAPPQGVTAGAVLTGVVVVLVGWAASIWANRAADPQALKIPAGVSVFALFYVVTQGLERLLEPFARLWDGTRAPTGERDAASVEAERHKAVREVAAAQAVRHKAAGDMAAMQEALDTVATRQEAMQEALETVAKKQATVEQRRANRTVVLWAVASVLGMALSGVLGLYLLHAVGLQDDLIGLDGRVTGSLGSAAGVRHALDLLVTGLAIGGGTKPLHDLIQNIQEAKNEKKDPANVRP
jgi:hypothetical protein